MKSLSGHYLFCNSVGARMLGRSVEQILGRDDVELLGAEGAHSVQTQDRRVMATGVSEVEEQTIPIGERAHIFETTKSVYRGIDQSVCGVVGIARDITSRRAAETMSRRQQQVLEQIAAGAPLREVLRELIAIIEASIPGVLGSFLLLDRVHRRLHIASGNSLPEAYNAAIEGLSIGPQVGSCGTAAFRGESVYVDDIQTDPLWDDYRALAAKFDLRACWSMPILSRKGDGKTVLGTFAVYARQTGVLNEQLHDILIRIEHLACIAIETDHHRQKLAASEARLRTFVENSPDAFFLHGREGLIIDVNSQACEHLGYTREELIGAYPQMFNFHSDRKLIAKVGESLRRGEQCAFETIHRHKDGHEFPVEVRISPFVQDGEMFSISSVQDITQRKQTEDRLHRERMLLEQSQSLAHIGSLEWDLQTDTMIWSDELYRLYGYSPGDTSLSLERFLEHIHPNDRDGIHDSIQTACKDRETFRQEKRIIRADGVERTLESQWVVIFDEMNKPVRIVGACQDITERKQADIALRNSEERFRSLADAIPQIVLVANPDGGLTHLNAKAAEYTRISTDQLLEWNWTQVIHPDDLEETLAEWSMILSTGISRDVDFRIRRWDGEYRWHIARQVPIHDSQGAISCWYATCTDIEDLKRADAQLRISESRLAEAQRIAHIGSWEWEPATDAVWWSDALYDLLGMPPETSPLHYESFLNLVHTDDRQLAISDLEALHSGKTDEFANDVRIVRPDGQSMWIHRRGRATRDVRGVLLRVEGIDQNITERKRAEAALRDSEEQYRSLISALAEGVVLYAEDGTILTCNASAERLLGLSRDQIRGRKSVDRDWRAVCENGTPFPGDDHPAIVTLRTGRPCSNVVMGVRQPEGKLTWVSINSEPLLRSGEARPFGAVCSFADITDRKHSEDALRQSEARLRVALQAASAVAFVWNVQTDSVTRYFSTEPALPANIDSPEPVHDVRARVHTEDRAAFDAGVAACLAQGADYRNLYRVIRPDGSTRWLEEWGTLERLPDGAPKKLIGIAIDITERKQAELALQESVSRLMATLESTADGILVVDLEGRIVDFNRQFLVTWGMPSDLIQAGRKEDLVAAFNTNEAMQKILNQLKDPQSFVTRVGEIYGTPEATSFDILDFCDGRIIERISHPQRIDGKPVGRVWSFRDITARKRAEREQQKLVTLVQYSHDFIVLAELDGLVTFMSNGARKMIGIDLDADICRFNPLDYIHPDSREFAINVAYPETYQNGYWEGEMQLIHQQTGAAIDTWRSLFLIKDAAGNGLCFASVTRDITEQKRAERELRDRERLLRIATGSARVGLVVINAHYEYLFANDAYAAMFGLTSEAVVGRLVPDLLAPGWTQIQPRIDRALAGERLTVEMAIPLPSPTNDLHWIRVTYEPRDDELGELTVVIVVMDIDELKRTEAAIRDSEQRFRSVLDFCPAHVFLKDLTGRYLFVNRGMAESMAIPQLDWVGRRAQDIVPGALAAQFQQNDDHTITTLQPQQIEKAFVLPDGSRLEMLTVLFPLFRSDGKPYALCGIATDITDRKRAEAELRRTADLLQAVADGTTEAVFVKDRDGKYLLFNNAASRFVGKSVAEVLGHDDTDLFDAESARYIMQRDRHAMDTGLTETEEETITAAGITRTFLATKGPYRDETGQIAGVIGISLDISARKETERALQLTQFTVDRAVDAVFWISPEGEILYVNEAACRTLGYERHELIGLTVPDIDPNFPPDIWPAHWQEVKRRGSFTFESERIARNGRYLQTEITVNYLQYEGREYNCAVMRDITLRKEAETERDRLWSQSPDLLCTVGFDGVIHQVNPAWTKVLGWLTSELIERSWTAFVHPDDHEATDRVMAQLHRNEPITTFVNRYRSRSGRYRWFSWNAIPVRATNTIYGFARDITEEKQLAEQVRQSQKMEAVGRLAGGIAHDFNNLLTVINSYAELLLADIALHVGHRESVAEIREAGHRAAELTAQLLAFSRKSVVALKVIDLNVAIDSAMRMLRRLIGEDIALNVVCTPRLPYIRGDQGQLEQVLI
ncbi:MAG: PAS domain S-box protein, partial [Planctomycetaceae bacterium]|nr:PAS domain S-box protein [Planctomycetaceae bacterium]